MHTVSSSPAPVKSSRIYPAVSGVCRWLTPGGVTRQHLAEGTAWLEIRTINASNGKEVVTHYWVEEIADEGCVLGYRLAKFFRGKATGEAYDIDTTFGPSPCHWSCECKDALSRTRADGACKHRRALYAALARVPA